MSKNRKFRSKLSFDEDEGEETAAAPPPPPSQPAAKPKKASLLSFDDGEDVAIASTGKKKSSKSGVSKFHRSTLPPPAAAAAPQQASRGEYTAERLKELAAATPALPASKRPTAGVPGLEGSSAATAAAAAGLGVIKLSGSFKPAAAAAASGGSRRQVVASGLHDDAPMRLPPPPRSLKPPTNTTATSAGGGRAAGGPQQQQQQLGEQIGEAISVVESDEEDGGFVIPGDDAIRLAKAKRERLRQAQLAPDYVPLGGASALLSASLADRRATTSAGSGSDQSEEEPEEHLRMTFLGQGRGGGSAAAAAAAAAGKAPQGDRKAAAGAVLAYDEDEDGFEEEQLRRALPTRAGAAAAGGGGEGGRRAAAAAAARPTGTAARRLEDIAAAGEGVVAALQAALQRAQLSHQQLEGNMKRTADSLNDALANIDRVQEDIKSAGAKYAFVQQIRAYLADLCDCLADKGALVEELEEQLMGFREEAAAGAAQEVQEDLRVLLQQGEAAVAAAITVLGTGGAPSAAEAAASKAAAAAEDAALDALAATTSGRSGGSDDGGEEVDEFGRDVVRMRRRELESGSQRRAALMGHHQQQLAALGAGGSLSDAFAAAAATTTSSSSSSLAQKRYVSKRREVLEVAPTVFADAAEDFSTLEAVKARLEGWKAAYRADYQNAYVPESAPALFAPFVRLELLHWDPLFPGSSGSGSSSQPGQQSQPQVSASFDQQHWYAQLFEYGMAGQDPAAAAEDPDANLVPQLIESLVLPQAMHLVKQCWDPFDFQQSQAVAALLTDLFVYVSAEKADMAELMSLAVTRLEAAVGAASVPPWPTAAVAACPLAAAVQQWCFLRAARLLRGLMSLRELISQSVLVKLGVTGLVTRQLLPCMRGSSQQLGVAVARAEAVVLSIPEGWFPKQGGWPEAQPLLDCLSSLTASLEAQLTSGSSSSSDQRRQLPALARRLAGVLRYVKQEDAARRLEHKVGP